MGALAVMAGLVVAPGAHADKPRTAKAVAAPAPAPAMIEDPCIDGSGATCRRHALDGFFAGLAATEDGRATHPIRISYFGDSVSADDKIEDRLRRLLGARFGDGGPGFVHVVPPHPYCTHRAVKRVASGWKVHGVSTGFPADRLLGFGGGSAEATGGGVARFSPVTPVVTRAEVYYLAQPGGGDLAVTVDGAPAMSIATRAQAKKAAFAEVPLEGTLGRLDLRASGRVRLFGVVLEARRGIVVDNLGVVNATAKGWAKNRADHWQGQLARRAPDLFVVMIGTNEAGWLAGNALEEHGQVMRDLLAPVRAANPDASCLVVSPLDQVDYEQRGLPPRPALAPMVAAQREAALASGCAFWDAHAWMGGAGASREWRKRGWVVRDFAHPTTAGAHRIADALAAGLLDGYARYRSR